MEGLLQVVQAISDVGLMIVLCGVIVIYLINHFKGVNQKNQKEQQRLDKINSEADNVNQAIIKTILKKIQEENHVKTEPTYNRFNERIVRIMKQALQQVSCNHALQFSYHNGNKDYNGRSYQRMSCINQVSKPGVRPIQAKYNNMFRTSMFSVYEKLNGDGFFSIQDIEEIKNTDPGSYFMLQQDNVKSAFGMTIKDLNDNAIGFLVFSFSDCRHDVKNIVRVLKETVYKIEGIYIMKEDEKYATN